MFDADLQAALIADGEKLATPSSGRYRDKAGREWRCTVKEKSVSCYTDTCWTSAYHDTFRQWGWTLIQAY